MQQVAVAYASRHGQTEKIAKYLAEGLGRRGLSFRLIDASGGPGRFDEEFDAVICGSPVYRGKFPASVVNWAKTHKRHINKVPSAFFTVTLNAADKRPQAREADRLLRERFGLETACRPILSASFAGALKYRSYWWPVKLLMKRISKKAGGDTDTSKDYEYTDWKQVNEFLENFLIQLKKMRK